VKSKGGPLTLVASQRLAEKLAVCTANNHSGDKATLRHRHLALDRIIEYVRSVPAPDSRLDGLCRISRTSERTLQYAFKERYGISPSVYIKRWKLNSARRCLLQSHPAEVTVHAIATSLGFFHQGQFTADYKNLFAELPSATLKGNTRGSY